jgi:hypothetical protein
MDKNLQKRFNNQNFSVVRNLQCQFLAVAQLLAYAVHTNAVAKMWTLRRGHLACSPGFYGPTHVPHHKPGQLSWKPTRRAILNEGF